MSLLKIPKANSLFTQIKKQNQKYQQQQLQKNKTKQATVATVLIPLAEVQLTGCFATFSSTSLTWEGRSGTTLCWPIGHDHSYLILNISS